MILDYVGVKEINGSFIVLDDVPNASAEEMVTIHLDSGEVRQGRIVQIEGNRVFDWRGPLRLPGSRLTVWATSSR